MLPEIVMPLPIFEAGNVYGWIGKHLPCLTYNFERAKWEETPL